MRTLFTHIAIACAACALMVGCSSSSKHTTSTTSVSSITSPTPIVAATKFQNRPVANKADLNKVVVDGKTITLNKGRTMPSGYAIISENPNWLSSGSLLYGTDNQATGYYKQNDGTTHYITQGLRTTTMPQAGTATYAMQVVESKDGFRSSPGSATANFVTKQVTLRLPQNLATNGQVTATIKGNTFSATGNTKVDGAFYGNNAQEIGGTVQKGNTAAAFIGKKQ